MDELRCDESHFKSSILFLTVVLLFTRKRQKILGNTIIGKICNFCEVKVDSKGDLKSH